MPAPKVRSKDTVQQRLRDHKREWNSVYKDFSQKLKSFKDGLNGRGNAKVGLPPSNIKEPFPSEVGAYLNQLAGEFQSLVGDANSIITEQEQYSKTRRRRKPKAPTAPSPAVAPSNVPAAPMAPEAPSTEEKAAEQLARLGLSSSDLNKFASTSLSRFWQYFKAIFSSKQFNKQRVGLLRQAADMYYQLLDFEENALSMSIDKIPQTETSFMKFQSTVDIFQETFEGVIELTRRLSGENPPPPESSKDDKPENTDQQPQVKEPPSSQKIVSPDIEQIEKDKHLLFNANLAKDHIVKLNKLIENYKEETDEHTKALLGSRIKNFYTEMVKGLAQEAQKKYGPTNIRSVQDIINLVRKNSSNELISDYMIKNAGSTSRFLKKKLLQLAPGSKAAVVRLEISNIIDDMKSVIKKIMDVLESVEIEGEESLRELQTLFNVIDEDMQKLQRPLHVLNRYYMKKFFERTQTEKVKGKGKNAPTTTEQDSMMDYILKRKLKRELSQRL